MIRFCIVALVACMLTVDVSAVGIRGIAPTGSWTPPYSAQIHWSATFDGTLLRKVDTDPVAVNVAAPSSYGKVAWSTSLSTNSDPYLGWFTSGHTTDVSLLVSNLPSGNAVAILSANTNANKLQIPNTYVADMAPAPTSTTWTVAWWMKPTIDAGDIIVAPEAASPSLVGAYLYRQNATQCRWAGVASFNYIPTNTWQLWVVTSHRELWVNGSLINSNGTQITPVPKRMFIGGGVGADASVSIPGLYDDIYYWDNRRFTAADVTSLYGHGSPDTRGGP